MKDMRKSLANRTACTAPASAVIPITAPVTAAASAPSAPAAATPTATTTIVVDGMTVLLTRKRIKNMYLRIRPADGAVTVSAPLRMRQSAIDDFVRAHHAWIARTAKRMEAERLHRQSLNGNAPCNNAHLTTHELFMLSWPPERQKAARQYLQAHVPPLMEKWTRAIGRTPTSITYRAMTSRWGSCTPATGRIRLNLELALVPQPLMEYVLVHELVHLWEPGHGAGFRRRMDALMPDWKQRRRDLNALWRF